MKSLRLAGLLVMVALGVAACGPKKEPDAPAPKVASVSFPLPVLNPAPTWQLKDVDGKPVASEQFKGKVVVVDFWATWCGPCRVEIPGYIELQNKYGKDGFVVIGISLDQAGPQVVKDFAAKNGMNYPLVMGDEAVMAAFGGVEAIPTTFLIDRTGRVRDRKQGIEAAADYEKKIVSVLGEKT